MCYIYNVKIPLEMVSLVTIHFGVRVDRVSIQSSGLVSTSMTHI